VCIERLDILDLVVIKSFCSFDLVIFESLDKLVMRFRRRSLVFLEGHCMRFCGLGRPGLAGSECLAGGKFVGVQRLGVRLVCLRNLTFEIFQNLFLRVCGSIRHLLVGSQCLRVRLRHFDSFFFVGLQSDCVHIELFVDVGLQLVDSDIGL